MRYHFADSDNVYINAAQAAFSMSNLMQLLEDFSFIQDEENNSKIQKLIHRHTTATTFENKQTVFSKTNVNVNCVCVRFLAVIRALCWKYAITELNGL